MKKYLVIGNPIKHSLSPKLHNFWIKEKNIDAVYEKKQVNESDIKGIINDLKIGKIHGINVTVPYKQSVCRFMDELDENSTLTQSVNMVYLLEGKVFGCNTDVMGFYQGLETFAFPTAYFGERKIKILLLGAGGVAPSIVAGLNILAKGVVPKSTQKYEIEIYICNRTNSKALDMCNRFQGLKSISWSEKNKIIPEMNIIINATSLGLEKNDDLGIDFKKINKPRNMHEKKLFFDIIYNPTKTDYLKQAELSGHYILNGMSMFIRQAALSFYLWHKVQVETQDVKKLTKFLFDD